VEHCGAAGNVAEALIEKKQRSERLAEKVMVEDPAEKSNGRRRRVWKVERT
jgi:hypothetical protein